jgi:two-component system phosphate regulon sensor histidine kinase PhoR
VHQEVLVWSEEQDKEISELKKLEKFRKEFIGNISHELKTPLFTILGYISTLIEGGIEDASINKKYLERSEKNLNRLIAIVNELETIGQLESGELRLEMKKFNIKELTDEIIESFEMKAEKKNMKLYYSKNYDRPIYVVADKSQITKLISNLLGNAIKYGYVNTGKIKISFFDMDKNLLVEITDNGPGISSEDLPRIYERFYRTDKARSRDLGGTGLGLAIVKHIIEAHKQSIFTRSTLGIGTTFGFTLEKG